MHSAAEPLQWLQKDFSVYIVNLFDTSTAHLISRNSPINTVVPLDSLLVQFHVNITNSEDCTYR
jgi:ribonuclease D